MWRDRALEELIQGPLDPSGLTEEAFERLVAQGVRESEQIDFKLKPHLPEKGTSAKGSASATEPPTAEQNHKQTKQNWKPEQEWAKDVCQFANHRGGLLVIGIDEDEDVAIKAEPTVSDPAALEQRLRIALTNHTAPTPRIDVIPVPAAAGGFYLAVVVPPSELRPHAVTEGAGANRKTLTFPVRDGADTRWMDESEVADRYRRRASARVDREASMNEMVDNAAQQLGLAPGLWLYVSTTPESLGTSRLDRAMVKEITAWHHDYHFLSPLNRGMYFGWGEFPAPGRVTFTGQSARRDEEAADPRDAYVELFADGRAFAAKPVTFDTAADARQGQVGLLTLADDTAMVLDLVLSWTVHQAGSWGTVDVQAGLIEGGELELPYATPLTLHSAASGELSRLANTRLVRRPVRAAVAADLRSCGTRQGRMGVVHDVASALLQHFGLADADMIESDGTMIGFNWGGRNRETVKAWASECDVAYRDHPQ